MSLHDNLLTLKRVVEFAQVSLGLYEPNAAGQYYTYGMQTGNVAL
jgi:hypothetical protein